MDSLTSAEPTEDDLAAIDAEWPSIAADIAAVDAEIVALTATHRVDELHIRRARRATRRVLREHRGGEAA